MEIAVPCMVLAIMVGYVLGEMSGDRLANTTLDVAQDASDRCNEAIHKYNDLVDKYNRLLSYYKRLFDAYDEAYHRLEENGLIGGDDDEVVSGDDRAEEDA